MMILNLEVQVLHKLLWDPNKSTVSIFKAKIMLQALARKNVSMDYLNGRCNVLTIEHFEILLWWKVK